MSVVVKGYASKDQRKMRERMQEWNSVKDCDDNANSMTVVL